MNYDEEKVDDVTLALMHLVKHQHEETGPPRAWKGFDWDILDRLHEKGLISAKSKAKSVRLSEEGAERSRELFEQFFCDDPKDLSSDTDEDRPLVEPRWREEAWKEPSSAEEMPVVELTDKQLGTLTLGWDGSPDTYFLDAENEEVDSFFDPDPTNWTGMPNDEELVEEGRQTRREVEDDDRYVVIPDEETQEAWRIMRNFISFVTDERVRELLDNAVHGDGAFRRFKDALARHGDARELYFEYRDHRRKRRIRDICAARGYIVRTVQSSTD